MLFLYKHNIIYVACITYKQIGGSKQYVQPGAIGIYSVLCSLNHAGEKLHLEKIVNVQYVCSMCCMITYGMRRPQNVYLFLEWMWRACTHPYFINRLCRGNTHWLDAVSECCIYTESNFMSRHHEKKLCSIKFPNQWEWELGNDCQKSTCLKIFWSYYASYASFCYHTAIRRGCWMNCLTAEWYKLWCSFTLCLGTNFIQTAPSHPCMIHQRRKRIVEKQLALKASKAEGIAFSR